MNRRPFSSFHPAPLVFAAVVLAVPAAAFTQADVPRTADGRPDLSGVWNFSTATPMQRPEELAGKERLTAEEAAEYEARLAERRRAGDSTSPTASLEARVSYEQAIWARPWTAEVRMTRTDEPLYEYACHEGNYSMASSLTGAHAVRAAAEGQ